ncbi:TPA: hypothetical protein NHP40_005151, partial [Pseudomonas aeruginosa]|nr:hypothetical protein [Pseudomonas aeruginosa]
MIGPPSFFREWDCCREHRMPTQSDLRFTFAVGATDFEVVSFTLDE